MNINNIKPDALELQSATVARSGQLSKAEPKAAQADQAAKDSLDVSQLSHLMADATQKFTAENAVRPEKIEQFKDFVQKDAEISDNQIDTIINRMLEN